MMPTKTIRNAASLLALFTSAAFARPPIDRMDPNSVGVEYTAAVREQVITDAKVNSVERLHLLSLYYAPFSFVQLSLGFGGDKFEVEEYKDRTFEGGYGLSTAGGLYLFSPALLKKRLRVVVESEFLYLNSRDDEGFRYSGPVLDPAAGVLFSLAAAANLEGGLRWHVINGTMSPDSGGREPFSNPDYQRYYLALTALGPQGVYFQADLTASSDAVSGFFEDGLEGASLSLKVGVRLGRDRKNRELDERNRAFFPDYDRMKEKQEEMSGNIQ